MLSVAHGNMSYEERNNAFMKCKLRRKKKLQKYLQEKFKRNFKRLPQIQYVSSVPSPAVPEAITTIEEEVEQPAIRNEFADKVLRRLSSFSLGTWVPSTPAADHRHDSLGREDSNISTSSGKLPPLYSPKTPSKLSATPSTGGEKVVGLRTSSMLIKDRRRSKAFLEMSDDLQAIIASHSSDAAVEMAFLQAERSASSSLENKPDFNSSSSDRKYNLDDMIARLPYSIHFKQYGLADIDLDSPNRSSSPEVFDVSMPEERTKIPLDRRILEFNDLYVEPEEMPVNQLKLVIIGHSLSSGYELNALLTTAVNMLADRCRTVGMSLIVFNSSWGFPPNDLVPEEQAYQQLEALEKFLKPDGSLVAIMVLLNDKYGQWLLPQVIPEAAYQYIYDTARDNFQREMDALASLNRQKLEKGSETGEDQPTATKPDQRDRLPSLATSVMPRNFEVLKRGPSNKVQFYQPGITTEDDEGNEDAVDAKRKQLRKNFRQKVRVIQSHSVVLRSVMKDFDPYINDPVTLSKWYAQKPRSTNTDYRLISYRIRFPDLKEDNAGEYLEERKRLETLLRKHGQNHLNLHSALAAEVLCSIKYADTAETFVTIRRFVDFNPGDRDAAVKFANYNRRKNGLIDLDVEANNQMERLIKLIEMKIPHDRRSTLAVRWNQNGLTPSQSYEHLAYIEKVVAETVEQVTDCLSRFFFRLNVNRQSVALSTSITAAKNIPPPNKPPPELMEDVIIHLSALQNSLKLWSYNYCDQLNSCMSLIGQNQYVFVSGQSGSGKSVLLAKIASELRTQLRSKRCKPLVVYRQIGLTARSLNVRLLLCDLKKQLDHMYFAGTPPPPPNKLPFDTSYLGIENEMEKTLALASKERPFFIVLDGIFRLLDFYNGQNLKWLSQNRNEHLHIILSLATSEESVGEAVRSAMSNKSIPVGFYRMKPLPVEVTRSYLEQRLSKYEVISDTVINEYLDNYARKNEDKQCQIDSFLLLDLVSRRAADGITNSELPVTLKSAIEGIFINAETKLGELLVKRAVAYLLTARVGLTRLELSDLLMQDSAVSIHLRTSLFLPIFLTPPLIISYLLDVLLAPFLASRMCDAWPLIVFNHVAVRQVAYERYVSSQNRPNFLGREVADYFLSNWAAQPRYVESIRRYERVHVCSQPVSFMPDPKWHLNGATERVNIRRVDELPFAAILAGQRAISVDAAKGDCYINYDFLLAACKARGLPYILDIFQWVNDHREEPDEELTLVYESLKLSRAVLQRDITQLGSQLCARLAGPVLRDIPVAPGDPYRLLNIRNLIRAISTHRSSPSLVPSGTALMLPAKSFYYELRGGHRLPLTAMAVSDDSGLLLTASQDNKMILWDLRIGGRIIRTIHDLGASVTSIHFARNNEIALVNEPQRFTIWTLATAELLIVLLDNFVDPLVVSVFKAGQMLVTGFNNSGKLSVWNLASGHGFGKVQHTIDLTSELDPCLKSSTANLIMPVGTNPDSLILVSALRSNFAIAWNAETNKMGQKLMITHSSGSILAIGRGEEVFAIAYMAYEENNRAIISVIDVFLAGEKFQLLHTVHGCRYDEFDKFYVNATGTHALAMMKNVRTNTSHFMLWNLDTEDHKHLASHNGVTDMVAITSLNAICTSDRRNPRILIWNLSTEVTKRLPKYKPKHYVAEVQRMQNYGQYVITRTSLNGPITVWNCHLGRCAGKSVRIEHGVTGDSSDVLLLRNTRLLVLTDTRSISGGGSSDAPVRTQIFSAFRVYDILRRVLLRRVADCMVPIGSSDDFIYYDVNRFMGLSESRNEFIVWEVESGFQIMRIKPSFDSMLELLDPVVAKVRGRRPSAQRISTAQRRFLNHLQSEHRNSIYEFIVSEDMSTIVTSHYSHFLCVIDCSQTWFRHSHTLTEPDSLMLLTVSALSANGVYLVTYSYDELEKIPYVTAWNTRDGTRIRRMTGQRGVGALAVTKDLHMVLIGKENGEMRIWDPKNHHSERIITGYPTCSFQSGKSRIYISDDCTIAFCLTAEISAWDLVNGCVLAVFTSDVSIQCMNIALGGKMAMLGTSESANLITLKLSTLNYSELATAGQETNNMFGELRDPVEEENEGDELTNQ